MTPEVGKTYHVIHQRKGTFVGTLLSKYDVWMNFKVVEKLSCRMSEIEGEVVTVHADFCNLSEAKV